VLVVRPVGDRRIADAAIDGAQLPDRHIRHIVVSTGARK